MYINQSSIIQLDFINQLSPEVGLEIFSKLERPDLINCTLVSKVWHSLANDEGLWRALNPKNAFGQKQWFKYLGIYIDEPLLPKSIDKILKRSDPFFPEKNIEDDQMLVLIPGEPFTLEIFGKIVKSKFSELGDDTGFRYISDPAKGCGTVGKSYWVLMTKDVVKGSRNKDSDTQTKLISKKNYEMPSAFEAAICIFTQYLASRNKERLFNDKTFIRCHSQIVVGGFNEKGLYVNEALFKSSRIGIAALKKLRILSAS